MDSYFNADEALRYLPIAKEINKHKSDDITILEIGSGPRGITPYIPFNIVGADVNFSGQAAERLKPVQLTGMKLPFPNQSFDYVICVDMLEHVKKEQRLFFVQEMLRLSKKKVFIAVPCGKSAEEQDKALHFLYLDHRGGPYAFFSEHLKNGLPSKADMEIYIQAGTKELKNAVRVQAIKNVNLNIRKLFMMVWINPNWTRLYAPLSLVLSLFSRFLNYGECYRQIFTVEFEK